METDISREKAKFDELKSYVPFRSDLDFDDCEDELGEARKTITSYKTAIEQKLLDLSGFLKLPDRNLNADVEALNTGLSANDSKSQDLRSAVGRREQERISIQRRACLLFGREFAIRYWGEVETIKELQRDVQAKSRALAELEKANPSSEARVRVAEAFELLLREFFGEKYRFDKEEFVLMRGEREMARGPHRTLSDGEKTAIAFCYFAACVHRKVKTTSDYKKLLLVFDDPVTSMSYDYVFAIAQILKNLSISKNGDVSLNPSLIDGHKYARPELLILTHSSYFFNICVTNRIVSGESAFAMHQKNQLHGLSQLDQYVAPFHQQLQHVNEVASGGNPDHGTGNSIRSILEAVGRFCRPDKCKNLADFISFLSAEEGMSFRSVLINSLSHGSYYDEVPAPDDLILACQETVRVVEKYAAGQMEIIRA